MASAIIFLPLVSFIFCFLLGNRFNFKIYQIITTGILFICSIFSWIIFFQYLGYKETEIIYIFVPGTLCAIAP